MTNEITKEEAKNAMEHGTFFGFVPHRLEIKGFPKYNHFPLNVLFMSLAKKDGNKLGVLQSTNRIFTPIEKMVI